MKRIVAPMVLTDTDALKNGQTSDWAFYSLPLPLYPSNDP